MSVWNPLAIESNRLNLLTKRPRFSLIPPCSKPVEWDAVTIPGLDRGCKTVLIFQLDGTENVRKE